jgi:Peroxidase
MTQLPRFLLLLLLVPSVVQGQAIRINKKCVRSSSDTYFVNFTNVDPQETDFIAILPVSTDPTSFSDYADWAYTCGSQSCSGAAAQGRIPFSNPLAIGVYRAVLARDGGSAPYSAYAVSGRFNVSTSCPSSPTAPLPGPVAPPVTNPVSSGGNNTAALIHINAARDEIRARIRQDTKLAPQFLRMAFHDCIGGCDGCIDLDLPDNAGIGNAIDVLQPIVNRHAKDGVQRADIWALSAVVGADVRQRADSRLDVTLNWWGRVNCESTGQPCLNATGHVVACSAKKGPHRVFPSIHTNTHDLYSFFADNFGFNQRETVAIMGAHVLGVLRQADVGISGPSGWVVTNDVMNNGYYNELVRGKPTDPVADLVNNAPEWQRILENGIRFWVGFTQGIRLVMLNTDIALVRNLDDSNFKKSTGRVNCTFEDSTATKRIPVCPHVEGALQIAAEFQNDNLVWLEAFRGVLDRMLTNGYQRIVCPDAICQLQK